MNEVEAAQVIEGLMLGDGGLRIQGGGKNACFYTGCSDVSGRISTEDFLAYLQHLKEVLSVLGIEALRGYPKAFRRAAYDGRVRGCCVLWSKVSPLLTSMRAEWYVGGGVRFTSRGYESLVDAPKEVPEDFMLTPISLAYWFMGDGFSSREKRPAYSGNHAVNVGLSTQGFDTQSIELLEKQLHRFKLLTGRTNRKDVTRGAGITITVLQKSVNKFMSLVDPYVVEPYRYKVKYKE